MYILSIQYVSNYHCVYIALVTDGESCIISRKGCVRVVASCNIPSLKLISVVHISHYIRYMGNTCLRQSKGTNDENSSLTLLIQRISNE